jgi:hypothetical protein
MKRATKRNFHLPLPADLYEELRREAGKRGRPATAVARQAIEMWLRRARASELHEEIAAYARKHAGSRADLDEALETAGAEFLAETDEY